MKFFYLLFILFFAFNTSFSQWTTQSDANTMVSTSRTGDAKTIGTSDGKTFVAYWKEIGSPNNYEMRLQLLDAQGNQLFGPDGMLVNNVVTMSTSTQIWNISIDASDNVYIAFNGTSGTNPVYVHKINTSGTQLWGATGVNAGNGFFPFALALTTGEVIISWIPSGGNQGYFQKYSSAGAAVWGSPKIITPVVGTHRTSAGEMAALSNGAFEILFHDRATSSISSFFYAQKYDNDGITQWASPIQLSNKTTSYNRRYSMQQNADTVYLGYYASTGVRFDSYLQRINPDGTLPWAINGSDFDAGNAYYEQETSIAYNPGSPYVWSICTFTDAAQGQHGEFVQKFDAYSGARYLTNNGKSVFPISGNDTAHKGTLQLINDAPFFMLSGGFNNGGTPINMIATRLDANGDFVWPAHVKEMGTYSNTKLRFEFTRPFNNQSVGVWTETRAAIGESRAFAQNITADAVIGPLPVTISYFKGRLNNAVGELQWQTETEINNRGFYVEKSSTGSSFKSIGFVASKAVSGVSNLSLNYFLNDDKLFAGNNYYRLKQVDIDGRTNYSNTVLIKYNAKKIDVNIYPNPATEMVNVNIQSLLATDATIIITDVQGKIIAQQKVKLPSGVQMIPVQVNYLSSGIYLLSVVSKEENPVVLKFEKR